MELTPVLYDTIVGTVHRVVDERLAMMAVPRREFDTLRDALGELAAAQARTEQRVEELAQAQARTEQRMGELAAAQARTEQRMEELAAAQARTEQRVEELAQAQARTEQRLDRVEAAIERLTEAQARSEQRLDRVEAAIERLTEAQARSEERLARVEAALDRVAEAQARNEEQIKELVAAQARNEERFGRMEAAIERLTAAQLRLDNTMGGMRGRELERAYRDKAPSYFGRMLRQVRVASIQDIEERLLPPPAPEAFDDLLELDLLVGGRPRQRPDAPEVWLAVEISAMLDRGDVERAQRRAAILRDAGLLAIPTVAGEDAVPGLEELARTEHVLFIQDGRRQFWEEALSEALGV
jgi:tetratricopeptide (TPR) repeat protein